MTITNQLLFIGLFAGCFFVPGWLALQALNIRRHRFLLAVSLSYAILIGILAALQSAKLSTALFAPFILFCSIMLGALGLARLAWLRHYRNEHNRSWRSGSFRLRPAILIPFAAVMGLLWMYLWWAGPYLEIPADVWNHVFSFRNANAQINAGRFGEAAASPYGTFVHQGNAWYLIVAYLMRWSGISMPRVLMPLTVVTVSTFCAGIFFCALAVFHPFRVSTWKKGWLAACATMFCAVTMGASVFAYIRYYAFAPTILNYLLFLSATLVALDWFNACKWWTNALWLIPALILTMNVVHSQEVLFTCFMVMGLALVNICVGILKGRARHPCRAVRVRSSHSIGFIKSLIVAVIALAAWLGLFYWLRHKNPIIWPDAHTIMPNMPIPAVSVPLIFKAFTISPPTHPVARLFIYELYTFYQTIGCWGLFVYIVFLMNFRQMAKSNYLLAGMAVPLLTVFNPITIDLFVRLITLQSPALPPITIWRFNLMLPLPFVAAFAVGSAVESISRRLRCRGVQSLGPDPQETATNNKKMNRNIAREPREKNANINRNIFSFFASFSRGSRANSLGCGFPALEKRSNTSLIKAIVIVIGLIGLIFPIQNRWIDAPFSRLYTLAKHYGNDVGRWKDLTDFAAGFQNPMLITDPNTGYIFALLYPEYCFCGMQWMDSNAPETKFIEAVKQQPELSKRGIIVINRRDGVPSVTGRISRHWPADAFLTSRFYSPEAIAFVESHPKQFKLLWSKDRIEVFQIIP